MVTRISGLTFLWVFLWAFFAPPAHAATRCAEPRAEAMFFVNLNYSGNEKAGAVQAAEEACSRLIEIPSNAPDFYKKADEARALGDRMHSMEKMAMDRAAKDGTGLTEPELAKYLALGKSLYAVLEKIREAEDTRPPVAAQLAAELSQLREKNQRAPTLIISGHHGESFVSMTNLALSNFELTRLREQFPESFDGFRHVLLMGCHTVNESAVDTNLFLFPRALLIGGFFDRGPLATQPVSKQFIVGLLAKAREAEAQLKAGQPLTKAKLEASIRTLESFRVTNAAMILCDSMFGKKVYGEDSCCARWKKTLGGWFSSEGNFEKNFGAPATSERAAIPTSIEFPENFMLLNEIYAYVRRTCKFQEVDAGPGDTQCSANLRASLEKSPYAGADPDQLARGLWKKLLLMRFRPIVQKNFEIAFEKDLKDLWNLAENKTLLPFEMKNFGAASWTKLHKLVENIRADAPELVDHPGMRALHALLAVDTDVICESWVEQNTAKPRKSSDDLRCQQ